MKSSTSFVGKKEKMAQGSLKIKKSPVQAKKKNNKNAGKVKKGGV